MLAPKSNVVEAADLIPLRGRQNSKMRTGKCLGVLPGSYRWHVVEGFHVNKGGPSGSSGACRVGQAAKVRKTRWPDGSQTG